MEGFDPATSFGDDVSRRYDRGPRGDEDETVAFLARLARLAGPGDALELAVGTGRIALPLAATGVRVDGIVLRPIRLRPAHAPELDLMARIAGLRLRDRWGGWNGEPYTATSWRHISVYERATRA
jgi:hypothetical protein